MEYCHVWAGAGATYWNVRQATKTYIGHLLTASLELLAYCRIVATLSLFYRVYFTKCLYELAEQVPLSYCRGRSTLYCNRLHNFSVAILKCYKDIYVNRYPYLCLKKTYYLNVNESRAFTHALFIYLAFLFAFVLFLLTLCFIVAVYTLHGVNLNLKIRFLVGTLLFCMRRSNEN